MLLGLREQKTRGRQNSARWRFNIGGAKTTDKIMTIRNSESFFEVVKQDNNSETLSSRRVGGQGGVAQVQDW